MKQGSCNDNTGQTEDSDNKTSAIGNSQRFVNKLCLCIQVDAMSILALCYQSTFTETKIKGSTLQRRAGTSTDHMW